MKEYTRPRDVLPQNYTVIFSRLRWWSDWHDLFFFGFGGSVYLLQVKVNRLNKKKFEIREMSGFFQTAAPNNTPWVSGC